jgi:hypothetical protein
MKQTFLTSILVGQLAGQRAFAGSTIVKKDFDPQPFKIDLSKDVPRLLELVNQTHLPESEEYPGLGETFGIDLGVLKDLQTEWTTSFDWKTQEASLNK